MPCRPQKATSCKKQPGVWCVGARSPEYTRVRVGTRTVGSVYRFRFRSLFFLLGIILVFMASIKCTVDSSTFRGSTLHTRALLPNRAPLLAQCLNLTSSTLPPTQSWPFLILTFFFLLFIESIKHLIFPRNCKQIFADRREIFVACLRSKDLLWICNLSVSVIVNYYLSLSK